MRLRPSPKVVVVPAMMLAAMSPAHAGLIATSGGTSSFTVSTDSAPDTSGVLNGVLMLAAPAEITYTYVGKEAGWNNYFVAIGDFDEHSFETALSVAGDSFTVRQMAPGELNFSLMAAGGNQGTFVNGQGGSQAGMGLLLQLLSETSALIAFDDGGAGPDGDFNDLMVRIDVRAISVPEPGSMALLLTGLATLGLRKRGESPGDSRA